MDGTVENLLLSGLHRTYRTPDGRPPNPQLPSFLSRGQAGSAAAAQHAGLERASRLPVCSWDEGGVAVDCRRGAAVAEPARECPDIDPGSNQPVARKCRRSWRRTASESPTRRRALMKRWVVVSGHHGREPSTSNEKTKARGRSLVRHAVALSSRSSRYVSRRATVSPPRAMRRT